MDFGLRVSHLLVPHSELSRCPSSALGFGGCFFSRALNVFFQDSPTYSTRMAGSESSLHITVLRTRWVHRDILMSIC